jgi:hypothetical protein
MPVAHALHEAGVAVSPVELQALPLDVEFVDVDELGPALDAEIAARSGRRFTAGESRRRGTWKRLLSRGIAGWAFANFVKERTRRQR